MASTLRVGCTPSCRRDATCGSISAIGQFVATRLPSSARRLSTRCSSVRRATLRCACSTLAAAQAVRNRRTFIACYRAVRKWSAWLPSIRRSTIACCNAYRARRTIAAACKMCRLTTARRSFQCRHCRRLALSRADRAAGALSRARTTLRYGGALLLAGGDRPACIAAAAAAAAATAAVELVALASALRAGATVARAQSRRASCRWPQYAALLEARAVCRRARRSTSPTSCWRRSPPTWTRSSRAADGVLGVAQSSSISRICGAAPALRACATSCLRMCA
jgi:hypothetical protein